MKIFILSIFISLFCCISPSNVKNVPISITIINTGNNVCALSITGPYNSIDGEWVLDSARRFNIEKNCGSTVLKVPATVHIHAMGYRGGPHSIPAVIYEGYRTQDTLFIF
jgi:hypothetical protein